jgi:hypothetical protein
MKPECYPKYLLAGAAVCLAAGIAWWGIAFRSDSQPPQAATDTASPNRKDAPEHLAANSWEQMEREARREEFNRILEAGVWPEDCSNLLEFFRFLFNRDSALALKFYHLAPENHKKRDAAWCIASEWLRRNPSACLQWMSSDSWVKNNYSAVRSSISNALDNVDFNRHDPGEVIAAITRWADAQSNPQVALDIKYNHTREGVWAAFGTRTEVGLIVERMTQMGLESEIHCALAGRARTAPTEVVDFYERRGELIPDRVAKGLIQGRLDERPDEAFGYLEKHQWQDSLSIGTLAQNVMNRYLDTDSMAASASLSKMQSSKTKDFCIKAMAGWLSTRGSSTEISKWLPAIQDPKVKQAVEQLAR